MKDKDLTQRLAAVRLVAMDVDGTYTDGLLYYDADGGVMKAFHAHDGFALQLLKLAGIRRGFITGRADSSTKARADYLKVDFYHSLIGDKGQAMKEVLARYDIDPAQSMFIGDDLNDLKGFEAAGIAVAVNNGSPHVKKRADLVTELPGGAGAVREVAEMILRAREIDPVELWLSASGLVR